MANSSLFVDENGVYTEEGAYQPFFGEILGLLGGAGRPLLIFIQTRMMPYSIRSRYPRAFHQYLKPLDDDIVSELLTFSFKEMGIEFTEKQIADVTSLLDGHPYNVRSAVNVALNY